jgi:hypothetical protein
MVTTPPKKSADSAGYPKKSPSLNKSALGSPLKGKFKTNSSSNKLFVEGLQNGVVLAYVQKAQKREEAFLVYDFDLIKNSETMAANLSVNDIIQRKGGDGTTPMPQKEGSAYPWRALTFLVGSDFQTCENRREFGNGLVAFFNSHATTRFYKYPKSTQFAGDLTKSPPRAVSAAVLDKVVIELIQLAYPEATFNEIAQHDDIMETFWDNITIGKIAMKDHEINNDSFIGEESEEDEDDKEGLGGNNSEEKKVEHDLGDEDSDDESE